MIQAELNLSPQRFRQSEFRFLHQAKEQLRPSI